MQKNSIISVIFLLFLHGSILGQGMTCATSQLFCSDTLITYEAGTSGNAEPGAYYGCLLVQPAPAWFHMLIEDPGSITIYMYSTPLVDIDFICWGPFTDPADPCLEGLTSYTTIDCSYSPNPTEFCEIPEGQTGEFYIMMITNYSQQPAEITFTQTSGSGSLDCTIDQSDLVIQNQNIDNVVVEPGGIAYSSCDVHNQGNSPTGLSLLGYFLSSDSIYGNDDLEIISTVVESLDSGQASSQNQALIIPANTATGVWYILFFADAINSIEESDENNNLGFAQINVSNTIGIPCPDPPATELGLKVYPNPANDHLFIDFSGVKEKPLTIELFNTLGLCISTLNYDEASPGIISLNIDLPSATYFLRFRFAEKIFHKKLLISE